jgi:5-methylcytosine-specific restriction endonuclease McrA
VKLSALIGPLLDAKADHELIRRTLLAYEADPAGTIAAFCPPGQRLRARQWDKVRGRILERDGYLCAYCGDYGDTVDHIQPIASGGSNDDANLVACCSFCNGSKGAKSLTEWRHTH